MVGLIDVRLNKEAVSIFMLRLPFFIYVKLLFTSSDSVSNPD